MGHGFNQENFTILFNTKNKKLYPLITRDNFIAPIQIETDIFAQISTWNHFYKAKSINVKNKLLAFIYLNPIARVDALKEIKKIEISTIEKNCF
jgi:hypothetical protein